MLCRSQPVSLRVVPVFTACLTLGDHCNIIQMESKPIYYIKLLKYVSILKNGFNSFFKFSEICNEIIDLPIMIISIGEFCILHI